jgi:hypothetical protein
MTTILQEMVILSSYSSPIFARLTIYSPLMISYRQGDYRHNASLFRITVRWPVSTIKAGALVTTGDWLRV